MKNFDLSTIKSPFTITLVGIPLVGKSTFVNSLFGAEFKIISSDDITMELYDGTYDEAHRKSDRKVVDKEISRRTIECAKNKNNVIFDMMNIRFKRRRRNLGQFDKSYTNICIVFTTPSNDILKIRNEFRINNLNKTIPYELLDELLLDYQLVDESEGFDSIIYI